MYRQKLCFGLNRDFGASEGIDHVGQLRLLKKIGFEGFFTGSDAEECRELAIIGRELEMDYQSIHAPFSRAAQMWRREYFEGAADELIDCARLCHELEVPIMVAHAYIGFGVEYVPNETGVESYGRVVRECERLGVKLALENTEGEEYLEHLMNAFKGEKCVGFCFDSGHEMCYNFSRDLLAKYGDRLLATHLNDNLGIRSYEGETYWHDDLHLLPFDGIADWKNIAERLDRCGFDGPLTFELSRSSKPDRLENEPYERLSLAEYLTEAYKRACRVAALRKR